MALSAIPTSASLEIPYEEFAPAAGMQFLVDTKEAKGYLLNSDGTYATVPVVLGQRRIVRYLGRTYNAATPEGSWVVRSVHTQGDRITFGKDGTFLRLYRDGEERSPYGIHTHKYMETMLVKETPYQSMGCILVAKDVLDKIQRGYELNGNLLNVVTVEGIDPTLATESIPDSFVTIRPNLVRATERLSRS